MLTGDFFFGLNILVLAGFVTMAASLTLRRQGSIRDRVAFALMGAGTALLLLGFYLAPASQH